MSFRIVRIKKELEIVSLIDVIFMLIIFGLVMAVQRAPGKEDVPPPPKRFSIVVSRTTTYNERNEPESRLMVSFFDANHVRIGEPTNFPIDDSLGTDQSGTYVINDRDWQDLPPCQDIRDQIEKLADRLRAQGGSGDEEKIAIDLIVTRDTITRIVNYITRACSPYRGQIAWIKIVTE